MMLCKEPVAGKSVKEQQGDKSENGYKELCPEK